MFELNEQGVIACDGVNSLLAESILGLPRAISSAQCAVRGLSSYPEGHPFQPTRQLHMANGFLFGMIPVTEKEVYWFISTGSTPPGKRFYLYPFMNFNKEKINCATWRIFKQIVQPKEFLFVEFRKLVPFKNLYLERFGETASLMEPITPAFYQKLA